jgi:hypothetical protein
MVEALDAVEESLHAEAAAKAGCDDFGDGSYREGLRVFLEALASDYGLDASQVEEAAHAAVVRELVGRLYSERGWKEHPEYATVPIVAPVHIIGIPRSGTTALHQLLACDPGFQGVETWLVDAPMVRPPRQEWEREPTYHETAERTGQLLERFGGVHWTAPDEYDECLRIQAQCFVSNQFGSQRVVPGYDEWFLEQDPLPGVRRLADNYRLIGASTPPERTWLLKDPSRLLYAAELLEVFPDARIVVTHRDPVQAIPSLCSLLEALHLSQGVPADPRAIGRRQLEQWAVAVERMESAREVRPDAFYDVRQSDLHADPLAVAHGVYERFGIQAHPSAEERMRWWVANIAPERRGGHVYTSEQFGLSDDAIRERFADYRSRYGFDRLAAR